MDQDSQGIWLGPKGPTGGAKGCSFPQELEKARKATTSLVPYIVRMLREKK